MSFSLYRWLAEHQVPLAALQHPGRVVEGVSHRVIQAMQQQQLGLSDLAPVAEVLQWPLGTLRSHLAAVAELTMTLLCAWPVHERQCDRTAVISLGVQIAYLDSWRQFLDQETERDRPWLYRADLPTDHAQPTPLADVTLHTYLTALKTHTLGDSEAVQVLIQWEAAPYVQHLQTIAISWLGASGVSESEARLLAHRIIAALPGHVMARVLTHPEPLTPIQQRFYPAALTPHRIATEQHRAHFLQQQSLPLFDEPFASGDLCIPLYVQPDGGHPLELAQWLKQERPHTTPITVITGPMGSGKSQTVRQWMVRLALDLENEMALPLWICLDGVQLGANFEATLASVLGDVPWAERDCVVVLDGLDQLRRSPDAFDTVAVFLCQLEQFHHQTAYRHKFILTTRPDTFPPGWQRAIAYSTATLQPFDRDGWQLWFKRWSMLTDKAKSHEYFSLLKGVGCFRKSKHQLLPWALWPLSLYLLGRLHREGHLERRWFLLSRSLIETEIATHLLASVAYDPSPLRQPLLATWQGTAVTVDLPLSALLFRQGSPLTLSHSYFVPVLMADPLIHHLRQISDRTLAPYAPHGSHLPDVAAIAAHLYPIFGAQIIPHPLWNLILEQFPAAQFPDLLSVIDAFYRTYLRSQWRDQGLTHRTYQDLRDRGNPHHAEQIEAIVGINTLVLLCLLNQRLGSPCYPGGDPDQGEGDRFAHLLHRLALLNPDEIQTHIGPILPQVHLPRARLRGTHLQGVDLNRADLQQADLSYANLAHSDLTQANLQGANLTGANLSHANFYRANLEGANLTGANLTGTVLRQATLTDACVVNVSLNPEQQQWMTEGSAVQASGAMMPATDPEQAPLTAGSIEVAEGRPILPDAWDSDYIANLAAPPDAHTLMMPEGEMPMGHSDDATVIDPDSPELELYGDRIHESLSAYSPLAGHEDETLIPDMGPELDTDGDDADTIPA
ncbi:pentapeptide repeat-containing protein [Spirulina major CS-329]|uniref:pentapeptide repeat-containing protein n=1 Tax=Spirulina TaxID=1154 RepID=UPI00232F0975|nr:MULTISPECIES: pentapeptide repeat-containing protein [Spirulina]MDB9495241.1 pentapeptide repeat-containing protein [Spirulina subsalsa CS-330]MDB9503671.1 pentapeptide repeat-containing protein [Spirulina major CS-329]